MSDVCAVTICVVFIDDDIFLLALVAVVVVRPIAATIASCKHRIMAC